MTRVTASEEKAALEWLAKCADPKGCFPAFNCDLYASIIQRLLAQPRLSKKLTGDQVALLVKAFVENEGYVLSSRLEYAVRALYAELTKPKTMTMWELCVGEKKQGKFPTLDEAVRFLATVRFDPITEAVTITPREVPADA